jgi:hypothetical protein
MTREPVMCGSSTARLQFLIAEVAALHVLRFSPAVTCVVGLPTVSACNRRSGAITGWAAS